VTNPINIDIVFYIIATMKKAMHMVRADSKQIVSIYNAAGNRLHDFKVSHSLILSISLTH